MNIFFTGSVRGGRADQPQYAATIKALEAFGKVLSRHVSSVVLSEYGETDLSGQEVLERELRNLEASDVVVADVTTPSHGVGYLIARATASGKRVVALYGGDDVLMLSSIIKGDSGVEVHVYASDADISRIVGEVFVK